MTLPEIIIWATVIVVGVPSAWRNPTAAALVMAWIAGQAIYMVTGDNLPTEFYVFPDLFVIAVVASKAMRTNADWVVLAIFPICWVLYVADISAFHKWYALWALTLAQFLVMGAETLSRFLRDADAMNHPPDIPGALLVVCRESKGYG